MKINLFSLKTCEICDLSRYIYIFELFYIHIFVDNKKLRRKYFTVKLIIEMIIQVCIRWDSNPQLRCMNLFLPIELHMQIFFFF